MVQKVISTHPENAGFCGTDMDMRIGTETKTPVEVSNGQLLMHLNLGDESLIYVWEPTE